MNYTNLLIATLCFISSSSFCMELDQETIIEKQLKELAIKKDEYDTLRVNISSLVLKIAFFGENTPSTERLAEYIKKSRTVAREKNALEKEVAKKEMTILATKKADIKNKILESITDCYSCGQAVSKKQIQEDECYYCGEAILDAYLKMTNDNPSLKKLVQDKNALEKKILKKQKSLKVIELHPLKIEINELDEKIEQLMGDKVTISSRKVKLSMSGRSGSDEYVELTKQHNALSNEIATLKKEVVEKQKKLEELTV